MLTPQVIAPRGVYESCFYVFTIGTLVLYSVNSHGILHKRRMVRNAEEYQAALVELTTDLDARDPPPSLMLVE